MRLLGGNFADLLSFSKDGQSVAYVSYPEGIPWKANKDGSERVQLSDSRFFVQLPKPSTDMGLFNECFGLLSPSETKKAGR